jgi:recombination protein RecA
MDEKKQSLKQLLTSIGKTLDVQISQLKDRESMAVEAIPSGSFTLDRALGVGGYPKGRIIEIYGKESGGKTLLSLLAIAEVQKNGGTAAFIDVEHSFDPKWAAKLGVDVPNLVFAQPDKGGEQALQVVEELAASDQVDLIVVDSVAGLVPLAELEGELTDQQMGLQARLMSKACRRLVVLMSGKKTTILFINQIRETMQMYGEKETTPGGKALKFYSSVRLAVKRLSQSEIKGEGGAILGHTVSVTVKKNKVGAPFTEAEFVLRYDSGVDRVSELVTVAVLSEVISQNGPMYKFESHTWKGLDAVYEGVKGDVALQKELAAALSKQTTQGGVK